jgi:Tol biopolymer transport system component
MIGPYCIITALVCALMAGLGFRTSMARAPMGEPFVLASGEFKNSDEVRSFAGSNRLTAGGSLVARNVDAHYGREPARKAGTRAYTTRQADDQRQPTSVAPVVTVMGATDSSAPPTQQTTPAPTPRPVGGGLPVVSPDGSHISFVSNRGGTTDMFVIAADGAGETQLTHTPEPEGGLQWTSDGMEVWVMNADGSGQRQITGNPPPTPPALENGSPQVSPSGRQILFSSNRTGRSQIYVMNADGSDARQVTTESTGAYSARWSPDGRRIVYAIEGAGANRVVIMNADGTQRHEVSEAKGDQSPGWSPDGSKILFASGEFPNINIYTMSADGRERRNISPNPGFDYDPVWSPDNKTIALVTAIRGQGARVWLMNSDGSGRRRVTNSEDAEERPAWSPDGRYLAFQASRRGGGPHEAYIHVVEISSGVDHRLGTHARPCLDETPSWFPDGKRIAFQSNRTGTMEVWLMNADGSGQHQVTGEK